MGIGGTLGFLGFGNMGQAIFRGLLAAETVSANRVVAFDVDDEKTAVASASGARVAATLAELASGCDAVVLATKPQDMGNALEALAQDANPGTLYISIAAGIGIEFIQTRVGADARVARVMPNTPALVGAGAAGVAFSESCTDSDRTLTRAIFEAVGIAETVDETALDAVTALSGSGPAYFFFFVECLVEAAEQAGLTNEQASRLAIQTALGAGRMMADSGEPPAVLRERVTSKGGTTYAALESLRANDFPLIVAQAVEAAAARSKELGQ